MKISGRCQSDHRMPNSRDSQNQFMYCPIESSQYPFQPTSSIIDASKIVTSAVPIPTPVKEKSSVNANCESDCPNRRDRRMEHTMISAKTRIALNTFSQFTL